MPNFVSAAGVLFAENHGHLESDLRTGLAAALGGNTQAANEARLTEVFFAETYGVGHDCAAHASVPQNLWTPGCGTFRKVTVAVVAPTVSKIERAVPAQSQAVVGGS